MVTVTVNDGNRQFVESGIMKKENEKKKKRKRKRKRKKYNLVSFFQVLPKVDES